MSEPAVLVTVKEAAEMLHLGEVKVFELIRTGELESVKIGAARRIPRDAVHAYVARLREAK